MIETLVILAVTFVVIMAAFYVIEKWWAKRVKNLYSQTEKNLKNEICKARLKFHMPSGWYCEFWKEDVLCYGVIEIPEEEHQNGELYEVKIKGFSETYELEPA